MRDSDRCVLAIDQGTTSTRAIVFTRDGQIQAVGQKEHDQILPRAGWVEHDPDEIWSSQVGVATEALARRGVGSLPPHRRMGESVSRTLRRGRLAASISRRVIKHVTEFPDSSMAVAANTAVEKPASTAAGNSTDYLTRLIAQSLATNLGQGVIVDNRGGANGTIGAAVVAIASWRWLFGGCMVAVSVMCLWAIRLPETLHEEDRQDIHLPTIVRNMTSAVTLRETIGYTLGSALVFGGLFGFINSSQQLIGEAFGAGEDFPLIFAICAGCMALSNWSNSRIVERFGARRVLAMSIGMVVASGFCQAMAAWSLPANAVEISTVRSLCAPRYAVRYWPIASRPSSTWPVAADSEMPFSAQVSAIWLA